MGIKKKAQRPHTFIHSNEHEMVNTMNYLSKGFRGWEFRGFVAATDIWGGMVVGGEDDPQVFALYVCGEKTNEIQSDHPEQELKQIQAGKLVVAILYGVDNSSTMMRFGNFEQLEKWHSNGEVTCGDNGLFYNS